MKKFLALLLAAMMIVAAFASCGSGDSDSDTSSSADAADSDDTTTTSSGFSVDEEDFGDETGATIKVWAPDKAVKLFKQHCKEFTEMFPDQNITIEVKAQGENDVSSKILNDPETAADVFSFPSDQLPKLEAAGVISPVPTGYIDDIEATNAEDSCENAMVDDTMLAYPETGNGYYLVYDKSVVSDKQAKSLEDILAACKKAGKKFIMNAGDGFYACSFAFTGGLECTGTEYDEDGYAVQLLNDYDEDEVLDTLSAFSKLMKKYSGTFTSLSVDNVASNFATGKCGAGIDGSWDAVANEEALGDNLGATKLPTINVNGEDKQIISAYGYKLLGVNNVTEYPHTAHILAYYLSSEDCQLDRCEELGWSPTNNNVVNNDSAMDNINIDALLAQKDNSISQVNVTESTWGQFGTLGDSMIKDPDQDLEELFDKIIANIKEG